MLVIIGPIVVFILLFILLFKAIKEEFMTVFLILILSSLSLYLFAFIDYKISVKQPFEVTETKILLEQFDDGRYVQLSDAPKNRVNQSVLVNGEVLRITNSNVKETNEESYIIVKRKKAIKDSFWLTQEIDSTSYTVYITEEVMSQITKDMFEL